MISTIMEISINVIIFFLSAVPEISDLPIAIKPDENVTLSCNASSHDVVLDDMDLLWFLVEPVDLDMVEVTTCSLMGSGSGSGSGGNGTVAGNDADIFGSDDHVIPLFTMLDQVESGFFFIADASVYQNGSYIVCVINNTDVGSCMSNYSTITGKNNNTILLIGSLYRNMLQGAVGGKFWLGNGIC